MRNFLKAEAYYVTKDPMFKGISLLLLFGSALLLVWMGVQVGFDIDGPLEPLITSIQLSFFCISSFRFTFVFLLPRDLSMGRSKPLSLRVSAGHYICWENI